MLLAIIASYTSFLSSAHIKTIDKYSNRNFWVCISAFVLASGIWSMHFIGMLAYQLPLPSSYNLPITLLSFIPAFIASCFVLNNQDQPKVVSQQLAIKSVILGAGVGLMHYVGMMAFRTEGVMLFDLWTLIFSIVVAVILSWVALVSKSIAIAIAIAKLSMDHPISIGLFLPASIMGFAISGMHYIGMSAMYIFPLSENSTLVPIDDANIPAFVLSIIIAFSSITVSGLLLVIIFIVGPFRKYQNDIKIELELNIDF